MKSFPKIQKSGTQLHSSLTKEVVKDILVDNGLKFSEHKEYELWSCPAGKTIIWYIVKNAGKRKLVIKEIKPTETKKYVNDCFLTMSKRIEELEKKKEKLTDELLQLKTKRKVKEIKDQHEFGLDRFMIKC